MRQIKFRGKRVIEKDKCIPMPAEFVGKLRNGSSTETCDMADGPCACGAWHKLDTWAKEVQDACSGWVYGYLAADDQIISWNEETKAGVMERVHPDTVGQFTGKEDRDAKDVYRGDLVKDPSGNVYEIIWSSAFAGFSLWNTKNPNHDYNMEYLIICEVTGTIHDKE